MKILLFRCKMLNDALRTGETIVKIKCSSLKLRVEYNPGGEPIMNDFTERTSLLLPAEKLKSKCIAVFGIGGVGSYTAEALVRAGIGTIILVDSDTVQTSNINRQLIALHSTIGQKKIEAAQKRYLDINPELTIYTYDTFILPENTENFFDSLPVKPDYIADCIDTVSGKLAIIEKANALRIPIISCMGTGNKLHPEQFRIADISKTSVCPLCRVMRRELKERGIRKLDVLFSEETPIATGESTIGSVSFVPSVAGLLIAGHIIRNLL